VKALKASRWKSRACAAAPKAAAPAKPMGPNDYMVIGLARIDDRLIHGQVATRWTKETNVPALSSSATKLPPIPCVKPF
jgi:PTS system mannose-specific IIB component